MDKIEEGLYVGDMDDGRTTEGMTVLNVSKQMHNNTDCHVPLEDGEDDEQFAKAVDTLRELQERDGDVLVHCACGISHSPAVITAYLMVEKGCEPNLLALNEIIAFVEHRRPQTDIAYGLIEHIGDYVKEHSSEG